MKWICFRVIIIVIWVYFWLCLVVFDLWVLLFCYYEQNFNEISDKYIWSVLFIFIFEIHFLCLWALYRIKKGKYLLGC
jgi:hypothetical protein